MSRRDIPGVIAPPPLIYLGFLLVGWGMAELGARPEAAVTGMDWMAAGFGLKLPVRRGLALTLIVGGLVLDGLAAGLFRRRGTAVQPWKPSTALIVEGPYRLSRNPIYVGFAATYAGFAIAMDSWIALILLAPCLWVIDRFVIQREERYLAHTFGAPYAAYRQLVRRWL